MLKFAYCRYVLKFKETAITSRASMTEKETFFIKAYDADNPDIFGIGECAVFRGLSAEDCPDYEEKLRNACIDDSFMTSGMSSLIFGYESALMDLNMRKNNSYPKSDIRIPINGLIWMGDKDTMYSRICKKLDDGFRCIKLKIGGINFNDEVSLLHFIRSRFSCADLELRLDANGAFTPENAIERLNILSKYDIHSIEQPIKPHQVEAMARIISKSPIPVALDEELIGCASDAEKANLLDSLKPHYLVLKPSLCGGFKSAESWIIEAEKRGIRRWATSALESNAGLAALTLWISKFNTDMPQGLGTGMLYTNNFTSPLSIEGDEIVYHHKLPPVLPDLKWNYI